VKRTRVRGAPKGDYDTWSVAAAVTLRPTFRDQQSRISSRQIERIANGVSRQIDAVNDFGELSRESHPHF
jgi:hypothetical protein